MVRYDVWGGSKMIRIAGLSLVAAAVFLSALFTYQSGRDSGFEAGFGAGFKVGSGLKKPPTLIITPPCIDLDFVMPRKDTSFLGA